MQYSRRGLSSSLASSDKVVGQNATNEHRGLFWFVAGLLPEPMTFPLVLERQYRDARARTSWKRDVIGYAVLIFLMSSLYVITTCYLHGQAEAVAAAATSSSAQGSTASHPAAVSTFWDAPTAAEYHKLQLHPKYNAPAVAAVANNSQPSCTTAASELSLQQLLHHEAAAIAANLASSSGGGKTWGVVSVLMRPQQMALLYLWRVWVLSDMALLVKVMTGVVAFALALLNPGSYCTHKVRTPLVAAYLTAPLLLLPLQLLMAADTTCSPGDCVAATAAAAAAQGYQVLLSYAPLVVLVSSVLHPLPFCWQVAVNLSSWGSLAAASLVLRLKYVPLAAAAAAHGSSSAATAAAVAGALGPTTGVSTRGNVGMLSFELMCGSLDGLLLSVLLPLLLGAWHSRKARKAFLRSGNTASSISTTTVIEQLHQTQLSDSSRAVQLQEELVDVVQSCTAEATRSSDQMVSCVSSVASNSSLLKKAAANAAAANAVAAAAVNAAAKSAVPSDSALAAAAAGQFCIVRGISIPSAAAAAASSTPNSSGSPSSCASSTLDQPKTPIMMLESRGGSSCSGKSVRLSMPILAEPSIAAASTGFTGSKSGASSSASSGSRVHDGTAGTAARVRQQLQGSGPPGAGGRVQHDVGTRTPERPSALYSSPLETVIVSFKLASRSAAPGGEAAAVPAVGAAFSGSRPPSPPAAAAVAARGQAVAGFPSASAAATGHGGASSQLKAEIEAAVRHVVAQSEYHVLCTSVSTFPGCVHLVVNLQLCRASDVAAQLAAAAAGDSAAWVDQSGSSNGDSFADVDWGRAIDWGQVVRQLQQYKFVAERGVAHLVAVASVPDRTGQGSTCSELHLQYMLVQDGAGRDQWYWQAAPIPPLTRTIAPAPAGAAANARPADYSGRDSLSLQTAGSSGSRVGSEVAAAPPTPLLLSSADSAAAAASCAASPQAAAATGEEGGFSRQEVMALQTTLAGPAGSFRSAAVSAAEVTPEVTGNESAAAIILAQSAAPVMVAPQGGSSDSGSGRSSLDSVTSTATSSSMTPGRSFSPDWQQQQRPSSVRSSPVQSFGGVLPHRAHIPMSDHMVLPNANNTPTSGAAVAMRLAAAVHGHAQGISMSGLTLPTDQGWLEMLPGPNLKIPDNLAASLTAAAAGLRIVITGTTRSAAAAGADVGNDEPGSPASSSSNMSADTRTAALKPLVDVVYWPSGVSGSSGGRAWPAGGTIAVQQLLPPGSHGSWLTHTYGPVLAINILVTPAAGAPVTRSSAMTECLLLQLPVLLVPSVMCQGLQRLGARMTREARCYEVAFHQHLLPLVRDIHSLLLGPQCDRFLSLTAPVAAAVAAGMAGSSSSPHRELLLQQHQALYGWLAANVLGFLRSQGAAECASALKQLISHYMPAAATTAPVPPTEDAAAAAGGGGDSSVAATPTAAPAAEADLSTALDTAAAPLEVPAALPPVSVAVAVAAAAENPATASPAVSAITADAAALSGLLEYTAETKPVREPVVQATSALSKADHFSVAEALKAAAAATEDAQAARNTVAETSAALAAVLQSLSQLSASAAAAEQQARRAESAAALAARRAAVAEEHTHRQHALYLIGGGHVESGVLGQSVWGLLGAANRLRNGGAAEVFSAPPVLPERVSQRNVLLGFEDERLEVQYRRLKALQIRFVDQVALAVQVLKEATIVWKIARALHAVSDTRLSLILLCKYEAVTLLPYLVALICPDFWVQHRNLTLMLSQIACALTVGMITATEIYRHEWAQLLHVGNATVVNNLITPGFAQGTSGVLAGSHDLILISRPGMLLAWFYLVVPLLQQLCVPDQLVSCVAQAVQSYLAYRFIFKGEMGFGWLLGWLGLGSLVSLGVAYVADSFMRRQAVAAARRSLTQAGNNSP